MALSEADWELIALDGLAEYGWKPVPGTDIAPGAGERESWADLHIPSRMLAALRRLNPLVPATYLAQALVEILTPSSADAITENHRLHEFLTKGYRGVSWIDPDGTEKNPTIRVLSEEPSENEWLAVNQVRVVSGEHERRFDVVLYVNGMPMSIIELKQAGSASADVAGAHAQLATYLHELPMVFRFVAFTVASDGIFARYGTPFTALEHFSPWTVDDDGQPIDLADEGANPGHETALDLLIAGVYNQERFGQLVRNFIAFDSGEHGLGKRIAKPHQYFAVTKAVASTVEATRTNGKAGVVWHTQGSGKSMEMELYVHLVHTRPELLNPTVVVITDRTELDGQLFDTFSRSLLLPERPVQFVNRAELRSALTTRRTGGIYFTTLQKFGRTEAEREGGFEHPELTDRRNVIVVVDEAHRSHYDDLDGYARHLKDALPHATLIAFTGTPISFVDRNTREVFGDYIDIYDLTRAVTDGATVPVVFEPRLITVERAEDVTEEEINASADEATLGLDDVARERIEASVAIVNAIYGAPARIETLAADLVDHWERRRDAMSPFIGVPGKALVVGGTREICAHLYDAIVALRPDWHSDNDAEGKIKVVYSGTPSDPEPIRRHVRRPSQEKAVKQRLRDPDDELEIVIVKDMLLTGFDAPPLHTLYLDRPLKGALLMQTLARANRTFRGKQDGLLVAYAPLAENLDKALAEYTATDQATRPIGRDIAESVALAEGLIAQLDALTAGYPWRTKLTGGPKDWVRAAVGLTNHLRSPQTPGNDAEDPDDRLRVRFRKLANQLARAWALCAGGDNLTHLKLPAQFYEEVRVWMTKFDAEDARSSGRPIPEEVQRLLRSLIATSTASGEVVDIYAAAGLERPSLTDLGPELAKRATESPNPHLAIEALRAVLVEEARRATSGNTIRARAFSERIAELMRKYTNSQLTSAEVIAELIALAKEVASEAGRGNRFDPELSRDELAFYDAVAQNESAVTELGDDILAVIARDLVAVMRRDVRTDWTVRDDVRAKLRASIKRLLTKHGYPPDKQPEAIKLVIEQMESMAPRFAEAE